MGEVDLRSNPILLSVKQMRFRWTPTSNQVVGLSGFDLADAYNDYFWNLYAKSVRGSTCINP